MQTDVVKPEEFERAARESLVAEISAETAVSEVFINPESRTKFIQGLNTFGDGVFLGGRTLRDKMLRCKTIDFADRVKSNADEILGEGTPRELKVLQLLPTLLEYPTERMVTADLDFLVDDSNFDLVARTFSSANFQTRSLCADNGVRLVKVAGENGVATFASSSETWHTQAPWPKIGTIHAPLVIEGGISKFKLDTKWGNVYLYPLCCPGMGLGELSDPSDAKNVSAAGRALLGSFTIATPIPDQDLNSDNLRYQPIRLPLGNFRKALCDVVTNFAPLLEEIKQGKLPVKPVKTGIRDMTLALFEILSKGDNWDRARGDDFFGQIKIAYMQGCPR